jgi:two-component system chemotaxis sensor kinase CheA
MVRDLSAELGKEIVFNTRGTETELDKSIIENLTDPILHILRNSIDHGIEDNETRAKEGKPKKGEILLKAYYSGANVYIEISDDGRGIDPDVIRKNAIEKGLIGNDTKLSKNELFDLIFVPGFSTTNSVTEVSGRGVGMDVVRDKISEIRGEVEVNSTMGRGTTVTIKLPLTLSIIDGLLANVGDTKYIIPLNVVDKIYMIKQHQMNESFYNTLILSGQQVPYYSLRNEFHAGEEQPEKQQVIIVSFEERQLGIVVDKVIGEYQAVLKPLGKHYRKMQIFSGGTILGDGTVALVMDTNKMIKKFSNQQKQEVYHGE